MNTDPYPLEPDDPPPPPPPPAIVGDGFVCRRCGYDLRGLPDSGQCPECGAPVMRSLRGNVLEIADPGYLRRLAIGALMVELGVVAICAVPIGGVAFFVLMAVIPAIGRLERALPPAAALMAISAGVLGLLGWFVLTGRDPAHLGADESNRARLTARIATAVCSVCWAFMAVVTAVPTFAAVAPAKFAFLLTAAGVVLGAGVWVQAIASMNYLKHLAGRVPDKKLVAELRSARGLAIGAAIAVAFSVVFGSVHATCGAVIGGVTGLMLTLLFFVKYADVVDRMRRHLTRLGAAGDTVSAAVAEALAERNGPPPRERQHKP